MVASPGPPCDYSNVFVLGTTISSFLGLGSLLTLVDLSVILWGVRAAFLQPNPTMSNLVALRHMLFGVMLILLAWTSTLLYYPVKGWGGWSSHCMEWRRHYDSEDMYLNHHLIYNLLLSVLVLGWLHFSFNLCLLYTTYRGPASSPAELARTMRLKLWRTRMDRLFWCWRNTEDERDVLSCIARLFSEYFDTGINMVPSDIAVGLLLVHAAQRKMLKKGQVRYFVGARKDRWGPPSHNVHSQGGHSQPQSGQLSRAGSKLASGANSAASSPRLEPRSFIGGTAAMVSIADAGNVPPLITLGTAATATVAASTTAPSIVGTSGPLSPIPTASALPNAVVTVAANVLTSRVAAFAEAASNSQSTGHTSGSSASGSVGSAGGAGGGHPVWPSVLNPEDRADNSVYDNEMADLARIGIQPSLPDHDWDRIREAKYLAKYGVAAYGWRHHTLTKPWCWMSCTACGPPICGHRWDPLHRKNMVGSPSELCECPGCCLSPASLSCCHWSVHTFMKETGCIKDDLLYCNLEGAPVPVPSGLGGSVAGPGNDWAASAGSSRIKGDLRSEDEDEHNESNKKKTAVLSRKEKMKRKERGGLGQQLLSDDEDSEAEKGKTRPLTTGLGLGVGSASSSKDKKDLENGEKRLLFARPICYYVVVDRRSRMVVVAIRGTMSIADLMVDLDARLMPLDEHGFPGHITHNGVLQQTLRIKRDLDRTGVLDQFLQRHPNYRLRVVGHSLGAATGTLLTLMLQSKFPRIRCIALAAPPLFDHALATHPNTRAVITSIAYSNDIVSRLSLASLARLKQDMFALFPLLLSGPQGAKFTKLQIAHSVLARRHSNIFPDASLNDLHNSRVVLSKKIDRRNKKSYQPPHTPPPSLARGTPGMVDYGSLAVAQGKDGEASDPRPTGRMREGRELGLSAEAMVSYNADFAPNLNNLKARGSSQALAEELSSMANRKDDPESDMDIESGGNSKTGGLGSGTPHLEQDFQPLWMAGTIYHLLKAEAQDTACCCGPHFCSMLCPSPVPRCTVYPSSEHSFSEILVSRDMFVAHMPYQYTLQNLPIPKDVRERYKRRKQRTKGNNRKNRGEIFDSTADGTAYSQGNSRYINNAHGKMFHDKDNEGNSRCKSFEVDGSSGPSGFGSLRQSPNFSTLDQDEILLASDDESFGSDCEADA